MHKINKEEHNDLWMGRCEKNFLNDASAGYYETETCNKTWGEWLFIWCGKKMWYMFFWTVAEYGARLETVITFNGFEKVIFVF